MHLNHLLKRQAKEIATSSLSDEDWSHIDHLFRTTSGRFFLQIVFPCWYLHGEWPWDLFRLASNQEKPNRKALKQLVQLDPRLVNHPKLRPILYEGPLLRQKSLRKLIASAWCGELPKVTPQKAKRKIGGFLLSIARGLGVKQLKFKQLLKLFDLLATAPDPITGEARTKVLNDPDIGVGETAVKALQRARDEWNLPPKLDKNAFENVQALRQLTS